ncbi:glycoside hydrolase family 2 protein [Lacticaseibacillus baoqingensis]|uniref:Glycoside hydrolase family 2 protein n=1 Tax=Lacticaseibacillus baoqingensis TaxID=2486013 RepID=A0ABW4EA53_9LACO|nr:sugar-binding domain-containing protein [Lacticaseibacillus baoqingensis]
MLTQWGEMLDQDHPLPEYPRPQLRRANWRNLNGRWQYAITDGKNEPVAWDGEIIVPYSPESPLSGVNRTLQPQQTLWYQKTLTLPELHGGEHLLLHFGAVDQFCRVFVDRKLIGEHVGGYWPFTCQIPARYQGQRVELIVAVQDHSDQGLEAYGKQRLENGGIWYPPQSGIWQTVWLEVVPQTYITDLTITPDLDAKQVTLSVAVNRVETAELFVQITAKGKVVAACEADKRRVTLRLSTVHPWTPADPFLYQVTITLGTDRVSSYFGMRKFERGQDAAGRPVFLLNGAPYYQSGLLDQGYWSDGYYTPPSDQAVIHELSQIKALGFNMLRKHIKIEPLRWYYHCDRLGLLVWQDLVSGGGPYSPAVSQVLPFLGITLADDRPGFGRQDPKSQAVYRRDLDRTLKLLQNVVSLCTWVPFNEGWGQFDTLSIAQKIATKDPTRLVDHASGWHDQGGGDYQSLHVYYKAFHLRADGRRRLPALTEFGGYSLPWPGHTLGKAFGYRFYRTSDRLTKAITHLYHHQVTPAIAKGLVASIYTQVSDTFGEVNGLWTFDRRVLKVDAQALRELNARLQAAFIQAHP